MLCDHLNQYLALLELRDACTHCKGGVHLCRKTSANKRIFNEAFPSRQHYGFSGHTPWYLELLIALIHMYDCAVPLASTSLEHGKPSCPKQVSRLSPHKPGQLSYNYCLSSSDHTAQPPDLPVHAMSNINHAMSFLILTEDQPRCI